MKKFLTLLLVGSTLGVFAQQTAQLAGKITNPVEDQVKLVIKSPYAGTADEALTVPLSEEGTFRLEVPLEEGRMLRFLHGKEYTNVYLQPGYALHLTLDTEQFDESLTYTGQGEEANNLLAELMVKSINLDLASREKIPAMTPEEFIDWRSGQRQAHKALLMAKKEKLPAPFYALAMADIDYSWGTNLLNYPNMKTYYSEDKQAPQLPENYYVFKQELPLQNDALVGKNDSFDNYVYYSLMGEVRGKKSLSEAITSLLTEVIPQKLQGQTYNQMYATFLIQGIENGAVETLQPLLTSFLEREGTAPYRESLQKVVEKAMLLAPGKKAPAFTLTSLEGDEVSLSNFKGKVIYLDFWASWCKPCLNEAPAAKVLKEHFANNNDLVFLYISIDENEEAWRKMIEKKELKGVHLLSKGWSSETAQAYQLQSIPRYVLIDRAGKILDSRMSRPSNEETASRIEQALTVN